MIVIRFNSFLHANSYTLVDHCCLPVDTSHESAQLVSTRFDNTFNFYISNLNSSRLGFVLLNSTRFNTTLLVSTPLTCLQLNCTRLFCSMQSHMNSDSHNLESINQFVSPTENDTNPLSSSRFHVPTRIPHVPIFLDMCTYVKYVKCKKIPK